MRENFKGRGKLFKLGAPVWAAAAAIEVEFDFSVTRSAGAMSEGIIVPVTGSMTLEPGHYTLITRDGHRHQVMNRLDGWQLLAPPG